MLRSSQKTLECLLGICDHGPGDSSCLFQKVVDRDRDYIFTQIDKIIKLEAKTQLMKEKTKKGNKQNASKDKQSKRRKDAKK